MDRLEFRAVTAFMTEEIRVAMERALPWCPEGRRPQLRWIAERSRLKMLWLTRIITVLPLPDLLYETVYPVNRFVTDHLLQVMAVASGRARQERPSA